MVSGHYGFKPELPHYPGTEALGVVNESVVNLRIGQRVAEVVSACCRSPQRRAASKWLRIPEPLIRPSATFRPFDHRSHGLLA